MLQGLPVVWEAPLSVLLAMASLVLPYRQVAAGPSLRGFARQPSVSAVKIRVNTGAGESQILSSNGCSIRRLHSNAVAFVAWDAMRPGIANLHYDHYMAVTAIHPGEHLAEELKELGMGAAELARKLHVATNRITGILNGQRSITGDIALRLSDFFATSAEFWLNLQSLYELRMKRFPG